MSTWAGLPYNPLSRSEHTFGDDDAGRWAVELSAFGAEVVLLGGFRLACGSLEMIKGIDPGWIEPVSQRMTLALSARARRW